MLYINFIGAYKFMYFCICEMRCFALFKTLNNTKNFMCIIHTICFICSVLFFIFIMYISSVLYTQTVAFVQIKVVIIVFHFNAILL